MAILTAPALDLPRPVIRAWGAESHMNVKLAWRVNLEQSHGVVFLLHVWGHPASARGVPSLPQATPHSHPRL